MSRLEDLTEAVLSAGHVDFPAGDVGEANPVERPAHGSLDVFAAQGLSFHLALPGLASREIVEVELETGSAQFLFPVSEPLGFFLAVVPEPAPG